ncbi:hypothetical protein BHE74_00046859 [Ensete ventricosum]|nr:hypothetical protein BHE74_00046859 [Ensete ventricosum]
MAEEGKGGDTDAGNEKEEDGDNDSKRRGEAVANKEKWAMVVWVAIEEEDGSGGGPTSVTCAQRRVRQR